MYGLISLAFKQLAELDWVAVLTDKDGGSTLVKRGVLEQIQDSALAGQQYEETSPLDIRWGQLSDHYSSFVGKIHEHEPDTDARSLLQSLAGAAPRLVTSVGKTIKNP